MAAHRSTAADWQQSANATSLQDHSLIPIDVAKKNFMPKFLRVILQTEIDTFSQVTIYGRYVRVAPNHRQNFLIKVGNQWTLITLNILFQFSFTKLEQIYFNRQA